MEAERSISAELTRLEFDRNPGLNQLNVTTHPASVILARALYEDLEKLYQKPHYVLDFTLFLPVYAGAPIG